MQWFTLFLAIFYNLSNVHPIHIAISEVNYAGDSHSLQVMHKIFMDDLENHIKKEEADQGKAVELNLNTKKENPQTDEYLQRYVRDHFSIKADGKTLSGKYLGKEYETDAVWIYVEIENVPQPKQLDITDTFLLDFHSDQANFIYLTIGNQKKSLRFYNGQSRQEVIF